jgi:dipeptidyl aminopeptidase/acylaminoacyl peptidase
VRSARPFLTLIEALLVSGLLVVAIVEAAAPRAANAIANHNGAAATSGRIAYSASEMTTDSPMGATQNVYSSTPSGAGVRLVARDATDPVWSPDGRWLAYVHNSELWRVRADGSGRRQVSLAATEPTWSPSGRRLAFTRTSEVMVDGYPEQRSAIYVVRRDGTGTRKVHSGWGPTWSPDGHAIAFTYQGSWLAAIWPDGRRFRVLRKGVSPSQIQFAPVGRRLVFIDVPEGGASVVRVLDMRTGRLRALPKEPAADRPKASPGRRMVGGLHSSATTGSPMVTSPMSMPSRCGRCGPTAGGVATWARCRLRSCRGKVSAGHGEDP